LRPRFFLGFCCRRQRCHYKNREHGREETARRHGPEKKNRPTLKNEGWGTRKGNCRSSPAPQRAQHRRLVGDPAFAALLCSPGVATCFSSRTLRQRALAGQGLKPGEAQVVLSRLWIRCAHHKKPRPTKRERPQVSRRESDSAGRPELQDQIPPFGKGGAPEKATADPSPAPQRAQHRRLVGDPAFAALLVMRALPSAAEAPKKNRGRNEKMLRRPGLVSAKGQA
jgi:hypothetical protein